MIAAWTTMTRVRPVASSARKSSAAVRRDPEAALGDQHVQPEHAQRAEHAHLLGQRGEHEVGVDGRDRGHRADLRQPGAEAGAEDAAATVGVQRADHLVAGALRVGERVEPDVDPVLDVREGEVQHRAAGQEQEQAENDVRGASRGDVEQAEEDEEVQQRRAEVALDDHDRQGEAPHREHRQQVWQRRQAERPDTRAGARQERPILGQVAGQEHDQDDLEQLRRLARHGPMRSVSRAPPVTSPKTNTSSSRPMPSRRPGVLVAAQPAVAANEDRGRGEHGEAEQRPGQLHVGEAQLAAEDLLDVTRSCGRRSMSSSDMPASIAAVGKRISSMRRPVITKAAWITKMASR